MMTVNEKGIFDIITENSINERMKYIHSLEL